jgi:uncharacterized membrane protein YjgN (DUF898 family)
MEAASALYQDGIMTDSRPVPVRLDESIRGIAEVEFTGRRSYLFRLVLKNALLTVLTAGLYRFWAKTRIRSYFWSNVRLGRDPLEYTGLPSELLIGFLIAVAVLLPISGIYTAITFYWRADTTVLRTAQGVYALVLVFLFQFALYRMWRYRLTRTTWHGIRFSLEGSAWPYAFRAIAWVIATVVSLGAAYPWMRASLAKAMWRNVRFGDAKFDLDVSGKRLFLPWLTALLVIVILLTFAILTSMGPMKAMSGFPRGAPLAEIVQKGMPAIIFVGEVLTVSLAAAAFFVWYRVTEFRYFASSLRLGSASFVSELSAKRAFLLLLSTLGIGLVAVAVAAGIILTPTALIYRAFSLRASFGLLPVGILTFAFVLYIPIQVVTFVVFRYGLAVQACRSLTVSDITPFEHAIQPDGRGPGRGEGLADALDVGAF